jgi:DNA-binding NarL/FixJ family response regulator
VWKGNAAVAYDLDAYTEKRVKLVSPERNTELKRPFVRPVIVDDNQITPLRVVIADDVPMIRRFLEVVLESCPDYNVVGMAGDGPQAVRMAERLRPDVVLLDLLMPRAYETSVLSEIRRVVPHAKVVVVSSIDPALEASLIEAGAIGFLSKQTVPSEFLDRLKNVLDRLAGELPSSPTATAEF